MKKYWGAAEIDPPKQPGTSANLPEILYVLGKDGLVDAAAAVDIKRRGGLQRLNFANAEFLHGGVSFLRFLCREAYFFSHA